MWRTSLRYSALGIEMGVSVVIGYGAGWWLDGKFNTKPVFSIVMMLFGIAAGFRSLIRVAMEVRKQEQNSGQGHGGPGEEEEK